MSNDDDALFDPRSLPQAHSVQVRFCVGTECQRPHVVLFDRSGKPFAQFVVPDPQPDGTGFFHDLKDAVYKSVMLRGDDGEG